MQPVDLRASTLRCIVCHMAAFTVLDPHGGNHIALSYRTLEWVVRLEVSVAEIWGSRPFTPLETVDVLWIRLSSLWQAFCGTQHDIERRAHYRALCRETLLVVSWWLCHQLASFLPLAWTHRRRNYHSTKEQIW